MPPKPPTLAARLKFIGLLFGTLTTVAIFCGTMYGWYEKWDEARAKAETHAVVVDSRLLALEVSIKQGNDIKMRIENRLTTIENILMARQVKETEKPQ